MVIFDKIYDLVYDIKKEIVFFYILMNKDGLNV